jgi:hypothetical protein
MPRSKKNPDATVFTFVPNPYNDLAKTTLSNSKGALNRLAEYSAIEHEKDATKPLITTKADLLAHTDHILFLIKEYVSARLTKTATLAAIFYIKGRLADDHPFVKLFRDLYYTETYKKSLEEKARIIQSAKDE